MRLLPLCSAALALVAAASAQKPTGRWEARWSPVDEARKMILALNVEGGKVTGYVAQPSGFAGPIVEGTLNGSEMTLVVERPGRGGGAAGRGAPTRTTYTATLKGDKLILTMPPGRGGAAQTREFTRVSTEGAQAAPSAGAAGGAARSQAGPLQRARQDAPHGLEQLEQVRRTGHRQGRAGHGGRLL